MLAIQANYHDGYIKIATEGLPSDAKVVVLFLDIEAVNTATSLSQKQQVALHLQNQNSFAQTIFLTPLKIVGTMLNPIQQPHHA